MKRFLVEWHEQSGIPDDMPLITPRETSVAVIGAGPAGLAVARELAVAGHQVTVFDELPVRGRDDAHRRARPSASRARPSRWTRAWSSGSA